MKTFSPRLAKCFTQLTASMALLVTLLSSSFTLAQVGIAVIEPSPGWLSGGIEAINFESREMIIGQKKYRVALKAKFTDTEGRELEMSDMDLSYAINFELEPDTGDILNIIVTAYP